MSTLYITEFTSIQISGPEPNAYQMPQEPGVDQTPLSFSGGVQNSAAFASSTRVVRLHTDAICSISFGGPATTANRRMAANQTEYFGVPPGSGLKVSVVPNV